MKFNTKIKIYSSDTYSITYCNRKIFNPNKSKYKYNNNKNLNTVVHHKEYKKEPKPENVARSQKRAKERIFDIVYLNQWDYFVTLTFNPNKVDSFSNLEVMRVVHNWFNYQHKKYGMLYILVPEFHRSGRIHIHALVLGGFLKLSDSGYKNRYGCIYNVGSWNFGHSTAEKVCGNPVQLASYITKYISKDIVKIFGKYYWSSRNLLRDVPIEYCNSDFSKVDGEIYHIPNNFDISLKYYNNLYYIKK